MTARHVIEAARSHGPLYLWVPRREGESALYELDDYDAWTVSHSTDLAVLLCTVDIAGLDVHVIQPVQLLSSGDAQQEEIGPGDEVFFSGLFSSYYGSQTPQPIVRFGNISMLPGEPVPIRNADGSVSRVDAYLAEARSWGGQSGSPAFVIFPPHRRPGFLHLPDVIGTDEGVAVPLSAMPRFLGVVVGHFDIKEDITFSEGYDDLSAHVRANAGVAVVVPAQHLIDLLDEPELVEEREERIRQASRDEDGAP